MTGRRLAGLVPALVLAGGLLAVPEAAEAQGGDGFLFKEPRVTVSLRMGYGAPAGPRSATVATPPEASTDLFGFTQGLLTIGEGDHDAFVWGGEVAVRLSPRVDLVLDASSEKSRVESNFRDWVDADGFEITQSTTFARRPVNVSARYYFWERGRQVSRFAWVPRDWVPYVGAGAGVTFFEFEQSGDFVDLTTDPPEIFTDRLSTSGSAFTGQVLAGLQYSLAPNFILTGEARYRFGSGEVAGSFDGFEDLNLSGLQLTAGIGVRF